MLPQMIYKRTQSPCGRITFLACAAACLVVACQVIAGQSRNVNPRPQSNSTSSARQNHVATLRASDSPEGSRVTLNADQSLNDYEAYRRGDRFYVKIPAADVPRAEVARARAFTDVKVQRSASSTLISFRLQPGATAHVEQHGNRLDVVFIMPGARTSLPKSTGRPVTQKNAGPGPPLKESRRMSAVNANGSNAANSRRNSQSKNAAEPAKTTAENRPSPSPTPKSALASTQSSASPSSGAGATPGPSPAATTSPASLVAQPKSSPTPSASQTTTSQMIQPSQNWWSSFKERARYWILLAQLNPLPVAIGAAVLLLLIALLVLQRRRAKATRRTRHVETKRATSFAAPSAVPQRAEAKVTANRSVATPATDSVIAATAAVDQDDRRQRLTHVADEVKKTLAGGNYDTSVIASSDPSTRQLVGAELLSALVGRNLQRRQRARDVFMKHGYFDDATRDLRSAESPNERAAAARRLSFVRDREATPHLIGGLEDSSPEVRRAAVEALMDLRDPAAIAPLNTLMQTEADRNVPRTLIKHAIDACATTSPENDELATSSVVPSHAVPVSKGEAEREVIEI